MKKLIVRAVVTLGVVLAGVSNVLADDAFCPPNLGPVTVDNVIVPSGGECRMDGTQVRGNVKVMPDGGLMTFGASIGGSVQADEARYIRLDCSTVGAGPTEFADCVNGTPTSVGGNVQVKGTFSVPPSSPLNTPCEDMAPGVPGPVDVNLSCKTRVGGNVQLEENHAPFETNLNTVAGNVQVWKNIGGQEILNNVIGGNLQCKENAPPATGGGNMVAGNKEGECAGL